MSIKFSERPLDTDMLLARRSNRNTNILFALVAATTSSTAVIATATVAFASSFCGSFVFLQSSADAVTFVTSINDKRIGCNMRLTESKSIRGGVTKGMCGRGGGVNNVVQWSMMSTPSSFSSPTDSLSSGVPAATTTSHSHHRRTLRPLVVCGPSGVGKGTIISRFMEIVNRKENEDGNESSSGSRSICSERHHSLPEFKFSVSHTTRLPRNGEIHGVHYHFVTKEHMLSKIDGNCSNRINDKEDGNNNNNYNFFVEYAQVHGNLYGTSFQSIYDASSSSSMSKKEDKDERRRECLLDIDVKGVRSIKEFQLRQRREMVKMMSPMNDMNIRLGKERSTQQYTSQPPNPPPTSNNNITSSSIQQLPLLDPKYVFITPPSLEILRERLSNRKTETPESLELRLRNAGEEMDYGMTAGNFDAVIVNDDLDRACEEFVEVVSKLYNK